MATLGSLNTYSTTDVSFQVETLQVDASEGDSVELPLMAWTPIHDIGPLTGNGIQVTHTFNTSNITMSLGSDLTLAQYESYVASNPTWPQLTSVIAGVTANATPHIVTTPIQVLGENAIKLENTNTVPIGTGDYTFEGWFYIPGAYNINQFQRQIINLRKSSGTGWILEHRCQYIPATGITYDIINFYDSTDTSKRYRVDLWNTGIPQINHWRHYAIVRHNGEVRIYVDGVRRSVNRMNGITTTSSILEVNATITDSSNLNSQFTTNTLSTYFITDQIMITKSARYTANFTPPTTPYVYNDTNIVVLLEMSGNTLVQRAAPPYATNRVIVWPAVTLNRDTGNAYTLSNPSSNVWTIRGIHNPEDYLYAAGFLNFSADYYGNGSSNVSTATGSWTTNIKNLDVSTYDYTYNVNFSITNTQEFDKFSLANIAYASGDTIVLAEDQKAYIADTDNSGNYTLTLTTESTTQEIQLSAGNVANLTTNTFAAYNNVGRLTIVGSKDDINTALANVVFSSSGIANPEMTYQSGGNVLGQSSTVFADVGTQPNIYLPATYGSLRFSGGSSGSSGSLNTSNIAANVTSYLAEAGVRSPIDANNSYGPENPSTIEFWFNDNTASFTSTAKLICTLSSTYQLALYSANGVWRFQASDGSGLGRLLQYTVALGWHHTAFCSSWGSDGGRQIRWFVDGQLVGTLKWPNVTPIVSMPNFGAGAIGNLDEFRISNTVRYSANFGTSAAINRLDSNGYLRPLDVDGNTLGLWRIGGPGDTPGGLYYNDRNYTALDSGYINWELTNPSGLKTNLQQYYYSQGL